MRPALGFLILAAGKGTRMHSDQPKVLQKILDTPLLGYVYAALRHEPADKIWTVIGHQAEMVRQAFAHEGRVFVEQREQLGTGHALAVAWPEISKQDFDYLCVINGDTPFVPLEIIRDLSEQCAKNSAAMGFVTLVLDNPQGYGRVLRSDNGSVLGIVEEKDFDRTVHGEICEVNSGIYVFDMRRCGPLLDKLDQNNAQQEFYITQLLTLCTQMDLPVIGLEYSLATDLRGINSPRELVEVEESIRAKIVVAWQEAGVIIRNGSSVFIGPDVQIEAGVEIMGPCEIYGSSFVGRGSQLQSHCWLRNVQLRACQIKSFSHIEGAVILDNAVVGPFARLRPGTEIEEHVRVGNFVEVKKSILHAGAKAGHLTYLGDSEVGPDVNIGAGTITCNYDGMHKYRTEIKAGAFIGSNTALVAPVIVGARSVVGAGSVVTKDVPDESLCVARARQVNLDRKKCGTPED